MSDTIPSHDLPPEQASNVNRGAHVPGLDPQQVFNFYSEWARKGSYDKHLGPENYRGPSMCADAIARHCPDKNAVIVDVAAGTGLLGKELDRRGYKVIDALEPADGMLEQARLLGIYRDYILVCFSDNVNSVPSDKYDALGIAGGMGEGHIKTSALPEMARIVKPGGFVAIVMREAYLEEVEDYRNKLEPKMEEMVDDGVWERVERTVVPKYSFENNGVIFVFRKSSSPHFERRIFSGIQPTGVPHLGNYLGAISQWVQLQNQHDDVIYSIVDLHSITVPQDPKLLRVGTVASKSGCPQDNHFSKYANFACNSLPIMPNHSIENILDMTACLIASGIDPKKSILFQQSSVPEHVELGWVLGCLTTMPRLEHLPQWKEKSDKMKETPFGLFSYPVLQSADIVLYKATDVPVGDDQVKHIELTRHLVNRFNKQYGIFFPKPNPLVGHFRRIKSLRDPSSKMSKSEPDAKSRIELTDTPDEIRLKLRKAVTDMTAAVTYDPETRPGVSNLIEICSAMTEKSLEQVVQEASNTDTLGFKSMVTEAVIERLNPVREEINRLKANRDYLINVLNQGQERARNIAGKNYTDVKRLIGMID